MCERFFEGFVKLLLCSILIQIISKNLHYGLVRATKLTCEGVESNPGIIQLKRLYMHHIIKVILGMGVLPGCSVQAMHILPLSFHQLKASIRGSQLILITFLNREIRFLKMLA